MHVQKNIKLRTYSFILSHNILGYFTPDKGIRQIQQQAHNYLKMIIEDSRMLFCVVMHCFMLTLVLTLKMKRGR